jgi:hypothetical protein
VSGTTGRTYWLVGQDSWKASLGSETPSPPNQHIVSAVSVLEIKERPSIPTQYIQVLW